MPLWEDLKAKGNEAFRAGKFLEAIQAYTVAIVSTGIHHLSPTFRAHYFPTGLQHFSRLDLTNLQDLTLNRR